MKSAVRGWGVTVFPCGHAARGGDFRRHLRAWKNASMARFGALRQLDFDHLDAVLRRAAGKFFFGKVAVFVAAAEVARADIPNPGAMGGQEIGSASRRERGGQDV